MPARKHKLSADPKTWQRADKLRLLAQFEAEEAAERAAELESQGWRVWYATIFGDAFVSNLADHHVEAIEWHWQSVVLKRAGIKPSPNAYFAVWPRGHRKSDLIRHIAVADACLLRKGYCLYVSSSRGKVHEHALSIETLIHSDGVLAYYPQIAKVDKTLTGQQRSWTSDRMISEIGYTWHFVGLKEGVAGANVDGVRVTLCVLDDVDERENSPLISQQKMAVLTRAVLATRQENTVYFSAQNYISRHGVIYQIHTGKMAALSNRVHTKPIPAFYDLVTEFRTIDGQPRDIIVSGIPSWPHYDLARGQAEIDDIGLSAFLVEMQHLVEEDKAGAILPDYSEVVHVIPWSAFNAKYNLPHDNRDVPTHWRRFCGYDHGSSEGHETAVSWLGVAGMNGPLPGTIFFYKLMSAHAGDIAGQMAHRILNYVIAPLQADPATYLDLGLLDRATADLGDALAANVRAKITEYLSRHQEFALWHASHEQKALRDVLRMIYALPFQSCRPKRYDGIEQWKQYMRPDMQQPHPFKSDQRGLCKFYMIVDDDQMDKGRNDAGLAMARMELPEWRWRPQIMTVNGLMDERPQKLFDNVANCLIGDTAVLTAIGEQPISQIKAGDEVWTRIGLQKVLFSGKTGTKAEVFKVSLSNGISFTGTAGHPVWIKDVGWMPLQLLCKHDMLLSWQFTKKLHGTESHSTAIQNRTNGHIDTTTIPTSDFVSRVCNAYTLKFGKPQMGLFQKIAAFTTRTRIHLTTIWPTLSALPNLTTRAITSLKDLLRLNNLPTFWPSSPCLEHGILPQKGENGIDSMQKQSLSHLLRQSVNTARKSSLPIDVKLSFVPSNVPCANESVTAGELGLTQSWTEPVNTVELFSKGATRASCAVGDVPLEKREASKNLWSSAEDVVSRLKHFIRNKFTAAVRVVRVDSAGYADVYNLEVERQPEFFANGILVHNSIQMVLMHFSLTATPLTPAEQVVAAIPPHLRYDELLKNSPFERGLTAEQEISHLIAMAQARKKAAQYKAVIRFNEETGKRVQ